MTLYEKTLLDNVCRALACLGQGALSAAGRIAAEEVDAFTVYGMVGADRSSWVIPLVKVCEAIGLVMDEAEPDARSFNTLKVWPVILKSFEQFLKVHGVEADVI